MNHTGGLSRLMPLIVSRKIEFVISLVIGYQELSVVKILSLNERAIENR